MCFLNFRQNIKKTILKNLHVFLHGVSYLKLKEEKQIFSEETKQKKNMQFGADADQKVR